MPLILDDIDVGETYARLARHLHEDADGVDALVRDPVGFLVQRVGVTFRTDPLHLGPRMRALSSSQVAMGNAFLHRLLANARFVDWARDYNRALQEEHVTLDLSTDVGRQQKQRIMEDFARAMIDSGELALLADMFRAGGDAPQSAALRTDPQFSIAAWYDGVAVDVEVLIYAVGVVAVAVALTIAAFQIDLTIPASTPQAQSNVLSANELRILSQQLLDYARSLHGADE